MAETLARIIELANVFVTDLNTEVAAKEPGSSPQHGNGLPRAAVFTAARVYKDDPANTEIENQYRVGVRPFAQQLKEDDRGGHATTMMVEISIQLGKRNPTNAVIDEFVSLSDRIVQRYGTTLVPCSDAPNHPAYPVFVAALGLNWSLQVTDAQHEILNPEKLAGGRLVSRILLTLDE